MTVSPFLFPIKFRFLGRFPPSGTFPLRTHWTSSKNCLIKLKGFVLCHEFSYMKIGDVSEKVALKRGAVAHQRGLSSGWAVSGGFTYILCECQHTLSCGCSTMMQWCATSARGRCWWTSTCTSPMLSPATSWMLCWPSGPVCRYSWTLTVEPTLEKGGKMAQEDWMTNLKRWWRLVFWTESCVGAGGGDRRRDQWQLGVLWNMKGGGCWWE